jgi:hypothetical protein
VALLSTFLPKKPLRNRDERVASYLCHNHTLTRDYTEAEEVLSMGHKGMEDITLPHQIAGAPHMALIWHPFLAPFGEQISATYHIL